MEKVHEYIYERITELSELQIQRKLWLNEDNDTGLISSYVELMCSLFDDSNFDSFIDKTSYEIKLSETTVSALKKLRELLNNYQEKESDEEIINDPAWKEVVVQAQVVIREWNKDKNCE